MLTLSQDEIRRALQRYLDRTELGIAGLAKAAGLRDQTLGRFLRGDTRSMRDDSLRAIERAVGRTVEEMVEDDATSEGSLARRLRLVGAALDRVAVGLAELQDLVQGLPRAVAEAVLATPPRDLEAMTASLMKEASTLASAAPRAGSGAAVSAPAPRTRTRPPAAPRPTPRST